MRISLQTAGGLCRAPAQYNAARSRCVNHRKFLTAQRLAFSTQGRRPVLHCTRVGYTEPAKCS